jgi:tRNA(Ile)-lysidine synthase
VAAAARANGHIGPGDRVLAGVSGGADSVALLLLLVEMGREGVLPLEVHAAHLHHGLRADADGDLSFVRALTKSLGIPLTDGRVDVGELSRKERIGLEEAGRKARYAFLHSSALRIGAPVVITAHTLDDQAETVLHRILRGTGLEGLAGILPARDFAEGGGIRILRPMLGVSRGEILRYLEARETGFREDSSNADRRFTRNRIRLDILPKLREINPKIDEALLGLAEDARTLRAQRAGRPARDGEGEWRFLPGGGVAVSGLPRPEEGGKLLEILRRAFSRAGGKAGRVRRKHVHLLKGLLEGERRGPIVLPGNVPIHRTQEGIVVDAAPPEDSPPLPEVPLPVPGMAEAGEWRLKASMAPVPEGPFPVEPGGGVEYLSAEAVRLPLSLRSRRPGDRFHPLGGPGRMRLKEFLRAHGIPPNEREGLPLVVDGEDRIVWVVPYRIAHWARIEPETKGAIRVQATGPVFPPAPSRPKGKGTESASDPMTTESDPPS